RRAPRAGRHGGGRRSHPGSGRRWRRGPAGGGLRGRRPRGGRAVRRAAGAVGRCAVAGSGWDGGDRRPRPRRGPPGRGGAGPAVGGAVKALQSDRRRGYLLAACWVLLIVLGMGGYMEQSEAADLDRTGLDNLYLTVQLATLDYDGGDEAVNWRLQI